MPERGATMSFDEANDWLDEVAEGIPEDIFRELNGGIVLLPAICVSPEGPGLYTLGKYHYDPYGMGRYISLYYGSFVQVYAGRTPEAQKDGLKEVLYHELTHHIESMAGVRDLEVKDEIFIAEYRRKKDGNKP